MSSKPSKAFEEAKVEAIVAEPEEDEEKINAENNAKEKKGSAKQERLIDKVEEGGDNDYSAYEDGSYMKFHIFMMLFAVYITPLFTNWGNT